LAIESLSSYIGNLGKNAIVRLNAATMVHSNGPKIHCFLNLNEVIRTLAY